MAGWIGWIGWSDLQGSLLGRRAVSVLPLAQMNMWEMGKIAATESVESLMTIDQVIRTA